MEITEHQANMFRALADRKTLQACNEDPGKGESWFEINSLDTFLLFISSHGGSQVRIKPDVIIVNGIEVPAPVKKELTEGTEYWVADAKEEDGCSGCISWDGCHLDKKWLHYEIVHLSPEAAGAHGKAMRAHKPG